MFEVNLRRLLQIETQEPKESFVAFLNFSPSNSTLANLYKPLGAMTATP